LLRDPPVLGHGGRQRLPVGGGQQLPAGLDDVFLALGKLEAGGADVFVEDEESLGREGLGYLREDGPQRL
jgi:hypothetical protein